MFLFRKDKGVQNSREKLEKIQECQKHSKRQQKLNISDLGSILNAIKTARYTVLSAKGKKYNNFKN